MSSSREPNLEEDGFEFSNSAPTKTAPSSVKCTHADIGNRTATTQATSSRAPITQPSSSPTMHGSRQIAPLGHAGGAHHDAGPHHQCSPSSPTRASGSRAIDCDAGPSSSFNGHQGQTSGRGGQRGRGGSRGVAQRGIVQRGGSQRDGGQQGGTHRWVVYDDRDFRPIYKSRRVETSYYKPPGWQ